MNQHINNKSIIITGASQGIGHAAALELSREGANLILVARNKDKLSALQNLISSEGGQAISIPGDVAQYSTLTRAVEASTSTFGSLDVLINNAGLIEPITRLAESDVEAWSRVVDVNYKGVYHGLRAAIPQMLKTGGGTVINISSGAASSALEGWSHYCSSKAAVLMLTHCAHKEYGEHGIRVFGLSPGTVATAMQVAIKNSGLNPVSKVAWSKHIPAEWAAKAITYLIGDDASDLRGEEFSIKNDVGRARVGLPLLDSHQK